MVLALLVQYFVYYLPPQHVNKCMVCLMGMVVGFMNQDDSRKCSQWRRVLTYNLKDGKAVFCGPEAWGSYSLWSQQIRGW